MRHPIGYWIKLLDRLIDESFDSVLNDSALNQSTANEAAMKNGGLTRRHWQALNVIRRRPVTQAQLDEALAPFLAESAGTTLTVVAELQAFGWAETTGSGIALTGAGQAAFAELSKRVAANRARITEGITPDEYEATVDTLSRMCANLQPRSKP
jgi:DNA-binding MarR family transcriptional regulator